MYIDPQTDRQTDRHTHTHTDTHTDRQTNMQADEPDSKQKDILHILLKQYSKHLTQVRHIGSSETHRLK